MFNKLVAICPQGCGTGVCEGANNTCDCTGTGYTGASCNTRIFCLIGFLDI